MSQDLFMSDDEDVAKFGDTIRSLQLSPFKHRMSRRLDDMLTTELINDKKKPRQDILVSLQSQQLSDPYSEFAIDENFQPARKIRSPEDGFAFFGGKSMYKTPPTRPNARRVPYSTSRRFRLAQLTPVLPDSPPDNDDIYVAKSTRRPRTAVNTPQSVDMITPQRDEEKIILSTEGATPRRDNLRPRKRAWVDQDMIPLADLLESYRYHKIDRQFEEEKKSSSKKNKSSTKGSQTTVRRPRRSRHVAKTPFTPTGRICNSKRRLRFDGNDSDEESMMSLLKRFKETTLKKKNDSEEELLINVVKRLRRAKSRTPDGPLDKGNAVFS